MARKRKGGDETDEPAGRRRSNLVPAVIIAGGLVVGAKLLGGGGAEAGSAVAETTTTTVEHRAVSKLEPLTLNLADGRFLRVGVAFELGETEEGGGGETEGKEPDPTDAAGKWAQALDIVIDVLGSRTYEQLVAPDGRRQAQEALVGALQAAYHGEIADVFFTEWVLQ